MKWVFKKLFRIESKCFNDKNYIQILINNAFKKYFIINLIFSLNF